MKISFSSPNMMFITIIMLYHDILVKHALAERTNIEIIVHVWILKGEHLTSASRSLDNGHGISFASIETNYKTHTFQAKVCLCGILL